MANKIQLQSDAKQFFLPIKILLNLPRDKKFTLLDIGAGSKYLKKFLPENIDYESLDYNGEHNYLFNLNKGKFPVKKHYDIIVCLETLEHTLYPHKVMKEIMRISKPTSLFLLSMPNEYNFYCRLNFLLGRKTEVQKTFQIVEKNLHVHNPRVKDVIYFFKKYVKILEIDYPWYSRTSYHNKGFIGKFFCFGDLIIAYFTKLAPSLLTRSIVIFGKQKDRLKDT